MGESHTPGPWRIEGRRGPGYIISAGMNVEGDGPAAYVGVLDPMFYIAGEPSHLAADARLIAAAPDLLEAAKHLSKLAEEIWIGGLSDIEATALSEAFAALDAAIAKALGQ